MAIATVFVISCGELDLSFASVVPVAAYIAAMLMRDGTPYILAPPPRRWASGCWSGSSTAS